jgi:dTDP-4-dehydrorhamnose reductase
MKILILGRDGQVGTALTATLAPLGEIVAYGRAGADFSVVEQPAALVRQERPDWVVNAAACTAVDKAESEAELAEAVNATAPGLLAKAAAEVGARLIHYSTDYVFDGTKAGAYVEDDTTGPLNVYGATKRAGEVAIAASGADHQILRTSWVHAPGRTNFIAKMLQLAAERDELRVIDDQIGAPTSARLIADVTARIIAQTEAGRPLPSGIYHLAAAGETSWNGYARFVIAEALRRGATLKVTPEKVLSVPSTAFVTPAKRPLNSRLSTHKLRSALGFDLPEWQADVLPTLEALLS